MAGKIEVVDLKISDKQSDLKLENIRLRAEIAELRLKEEDMSNDGLVSMYYSLNYQFNKLSRTIRNANIELDSDDKVTERFMAINKGLAEMLNNMDMIRQRLSLTQEDVANEVKRKIPMVERIAMNKSK